MFKLKTKGRWCSAMKSQVACTSPIVQAALSMREAFIDGEGYGKVKNPHLRKDEFVRDSMVSALSPFRTLSGKTYKEMATWDAEVYLTEAPHFRTFNALQSRFNESGSIVNHTNKTIWVKSRSGLVTELMPTNSFGGGRELDTEHRKSPECIRATYGFNGVKSMSRSVADGPNENDGTLMSELAKNAVNGWDWFTNHSTFVPADYKVYDPVRGYVLKEDEKAKSILESIASKPIMGVVERCLKEDSFGKIHDDYYKQPDLVRTNRTFEPEDFDFDFLSGYRNQGRYRTKNALEKELTLLSRGSIEAYINDPGYGDIFETRVEGDDLADFWESDTPLYIPEVDMLVAPFNLLGFDHPSTFESRRKMFYEDLEELEAGENPALTANFIFAISSSTTPDPLPFYYALGPGVTCKVPVIPNDMLGMEAGLYIKGKGVEAVKVDKSETLWESRRSKEWGQYIFCPMDKALDSCLITTSQLDAIKLSKVYNTLVLRNRSSVVTEEVKFQTEQLKRSHEEKTIHYKTSAASVETGFKLASLIVPLITAIIGVLAGVLSR